MNCPRCLTTLTEQDGSDATRLLCGSCGGFWIAPEPLANALKKRGITLPESGGTAGDLRCPRDGAWLATFKFSGVELDRCTQCGGLWLDKGEWEKISAAGRSKAKKRMLAAGAAGVAIVGGAVAANAMYQAHQKEAGGSTLDGVGEVVGGLFECLFDIVAVLTSKN